MIQNFREFNPGNTSGNEGSSKQNKTGGGSNSIGRLVAVIAGLVILAVLAFESVYSIGEQSRVW